MEMVANEKGAVPRLDPGTSARIYNKLSQDIQQREAVKKTRVVFFQQSTFLKMAASLLLLAVFSLLLYSSRSQINNLLFPIAYVEVESPIGYKTEVILSDGTVVKLNEKSKIKYPKDFDHTVNREIVLRGEAYFDVKRNTAKPFIINTSKSQIEVLGTSFNVRETAYDSSVTVAVTHGLVAVSGTQKNKRALKLAVGDIGVVNDTTILLRKANHIQNLLCWSTGKITFHEVPLSKVVEELNLIYGTNLIIEASAIESQTLTASLKYQALPYVIKEICTFMGLQYRKKDGNYILSISGQEVNN
jgi:ferric-dicitrate binding protein FerR (iron transport regulator)